MKKTFPILSLLGLICSTPCFCATTALQTITMSIASISNITTSKNPASLAITLNASGTGTATDNTTTYTVTSNTKASGTLKITGAITAGGNMPTNTSLTLSLASAAGTSAGAQTLSTRSVDLVTRLPTLLSDTGIITYAFNVTNGWKVPAQNLSRTVTLTLTSSS